MVEKEEKGEVSSTKVPMGYAHGTRVRTAMVSLRPQETRDYGVETPGMEGT